MKTQCVCLSERNKENIDCQLNLFCSHLNQLTTQAQASEPSPIPSLPATPSCMVPCLLCTGEHKAGWPGGPEYFCRTLCISHLCSDSVQSSGIAGASSQSCARHWLLQIWPAELPLPPVGLGAPGRTAVPEGRCPVLEPAQQPGSLPLCPGCCTHC